jgi:hypothetical protein
MGAIFCKKINLNKTIPTGQSRKNHPGDQCLIRQDRWAKSRLDEEYAPEQKKNGLRFLNRTQPFAQTSILIKISGT